jgi:hypothetical protein
MKVCNLRDPFKIEKRENAVNGTTGERGHFTIT